MYIQPLDQKQARYLFWCLLHSSLQEGELFSLFSDTYFLKYLRKVNKNGKLLFLSHTSKAMAAEASVPILQTLSPVLTRAGIL